MQTIQFDSGIREYRINENGILRMNPADPNLYDRFLKAMQRISDLEKELAPNGENENGAGVVEQMRLADTKLKEILNWIFGPPNNFEEILGGVNLLAVARNGQRVIMNLFSALEPILLEGAQTYAEHQVQNAVAKAKQRREGKV